MRLDPIDAASPASSVLLHMRRFGGTSVDPGEIIPFVRGVGEQAWALAPANHGYNNIRTWKSGGGGTPTASGGFHDTVGTQSTPAWASTSLSTRQYGDQWLSAAAINATAGMRGYVGAGYRSTTAGRGGFYFHARVNLLTSMGGTNARLFVGLSDSNTDPCAADPSAYTGNFVGLSADAADTNLKLISRDGTTTSVIDLGVNLPKALNTIYDLWLYCPPGGAKIYYRVDKSSGNVLTERQAEGSITANLPTSDVQLVKMWLRGGTNTTTQVAIQPCHATLAWQTN